jgi:integrase
MFKWAAGEEMIPAAVFHGLAVVNGLQKGRTPARETEPVGPVDDATVEATLPFLNRHVRGLVEFQRLTGCRPGEACIVRRCDIDMTGPVWLDRPASHKNSWWGRQRTIADGPQGQVLLREFFTPNLADDLFSPRRAVEELHAGRTAKRVTPRYTSHMRRNAAKRTARPKRPPADHYVTSSYGHAVAKACEKAFTPHAPLARREGESVKKWKSRLTAKQRAELAAWRKTHCWHPTQLRHSFATAVRKHHGLEAAQVLLGHSKANTTGIYAQRNEELAAAVAAKIGLDDHRRTG